MSFTIGQTEGLVWVLEGGQVGRELWKGPHEGTVLVRVTLGGSVFMVLSVSQTYYADCRGFLLCVDKF